MDRKEMAHGDHFGRRASSSQSIVRRRLVRRDSVHSDAYRFGDGALHDDYGSCVNKAPVNRQLAQTAHNSDRGPACPHNGRGANEDCGSCANETSETVVEISETIQQRAPSPGKPTQRLVVAPSKKQELEFLRHQVLELEETLRRLKRSFGREHTLTPTPTSSTADDRGHWTRAAVMSAAVMSASFVAHKSQNVLQRVPSMWEELAMRQAQQRQSAQVENLQLKTKLDDQLKIMKSLQRLLKRYKTTDQMLTAFPPPPPSIRR